MLLCPFTMTANVCAYAIGLLYSFYTDSLIRDLWFLAFAPPKLTIYSALVFNPC